jgi:hypothetical protein
VRGKSGNVPGKLEDVGGDVVQSEAAYQPAEPALGFFQMNITRELELVTYNESKNPTRIFSRVAM